MAVNISDRVRKAQERAIALQASIIPLPGSRPATPETPELESNRPNEDVSPISTRIATVSTWTERALRRDSTPETDNTTTVTIPTPEKGTPCPKASGPRLVYAKPHPHSKETKIANPDSGRCDDDDDDDGSLDSRERRMRGFILPPRFSVRLPPAFPGFRKAKEPYLQPDNFYQGNLLPCLQCAEKGMSCNQKDHRTWTARCQRCERSGHGNCCLVRWKPIHYEDGKKPWTREGGVEEGVLVEWLERWNPQKGTKQTEMFRMLRMPEDDDYIWSTKLHILEDLRDKAQYKHDRANWVYPHHDGPRYQSKYKFGLARRRLFSKQRSEMFEQIKQMGGDGGVDVQSWLIRSGAEGVV